ncbi:MAG: bile acid:sodium symporter family protein [Bacteroidaceae bacterium]|nr:bile acid:sodium symporter family protein [Bacteroidaceae bacterium]
MKRLCSIITKFIAVIVLIGAAVAYLWPASMSHISTKWVSPLLGVVMFGMGLTLDVREFGRVFTHPRNVLVGFLCQFTIMPLAAVLLVRLFSLPPELAVGVILVGCCPGGTSSNVITYLSKGDVALSVGMTSVSTLVAPVITPLLVKLLAGAYIPIRFWAMFLSIVEVIILPIALGLLIKRFFPRFSQAVADYLPAFSTIIITVIVMAVVAANSGSLHICGLTVIVVVILHNLLGLMLGLLAGKLLHMSVRQMTAVSIEVGMQNSGLACSLAATHFASMALAPVPGAVFSVWHNISGALAAKVYSHANNLHNNPKP